jgi:urease accessory protein
LNARLDLRFAADAGRTQLRINVQEPPWRVIRAFPQASGASLVHLHNVSGGVLAGDQLSLDIRVAAGAKAQVTSTGATRLYRHRQGSADAEQQTTFHVERGALLEYLPDMLIPFAGARHHQHTTVTLEPGAAFFWWESTAPGRQAMGEEFAYESLRISTRVRTPERTLLLEDFRLEPHRRPLRSIAVMEGFTHTASFYAFHPGRPAADWQQLESKFGEIASEESRLGCTIWGASALAADGILVRGLSTTSRDLPATLARFWKTARHFLTGEDGVLPRKVK